jgi:hypothetical protein
MKPIQVFRTDVVLFGKSQINEANNTVKKVGMTT